MIKYDLINFKFQIIASCLGQEDANLSEIQVINQFNSNNFSYGYNISPGGESAWNAGLPKESQPMYGKFQKEETKKKISSAQKGVPRQLHSEETKKKMSKSRTGIFCGENGPASKLSKEDVIQIKLMLSEGKSANSIAKMYNVSANAILHIKHGKTWK